VGHAVDVGGNDSVMTAILTITRCNRR